MLTVRVDDIAEAAAVVKGKKINSNVKFYIAAASSEVQKEAERYGYWQSLVEAGAIPLTSWLRTLYWAWNRLT